MIELILGGARSGKSSHAERLAAASGKPLTYLATATAGDAEMSARIARHQQQRQALNWQTIEEPLLLAKTLMGQASPDRCILVDCLTLWLSNCLFNQEQLWEAQKEAFLACLEHFPGHLLLVSNEVGQGVVPMGEVSRRFVDESGWLHQAIAEKADRVTFVTAGIPQLLKG